MADWKKHLLTQGGIALAVSLACVWFFDQQVALIFAGEENAALRHVAREVTDIGEGAPFIVIALVLYLLARFVLPMIRIVSATSVLLLRARSVFALMSFVYSGVLVQTLKFLIGRQRPHVSPVFEAHAFAPFNSHWHWHSYPSGHSQIVFAAATVGMIFWPKWRWVFLLSAMTVAATRVIIHQHFLGDVIMGSALGYLVTRWNYERFYRAEIARAGRSIAS